MYTYALETKSPSELSLTLRRFKLGNFKRSFKYETQNQAVCTYFKCFLLNFFSFSSLLCRLFKNKTKWWIVSYVLLQGMFCDDAFLIFCRVNQLFLQSLGIFNWYFYAFKGLVIYCIFVVDFVFEIKVICTNQLRNYQRQNLFQKKKAHLQSEIQLFTN